MQFVRLYAGNSGCFKFWEKQNQKVVIKWQGRDTWAAIFVF